jgi:hypothetical protein
VDISFDSAKSEKNVLVRGVPFELAAEFAWDGALIVEDLRKDYTWTTEVGQGAYIDLYPIATGNIGALEGYGPGLANTDGRSIVESCLIDM